MYLLSRSLCLSLLLFACSWLRAERAVEEPTERVINEQIGYEISLPASLYAAGYLETPEEIGFRDQAGNCFLTITVYDIESFAAAFDLPRPQLLELSAIQTMMYDKCWRKVFIETAEGPRPVQTRCLTQYTHSEIGKVMHLGMMMIEGSYTNANPKDSLARRLGLFSSTTLGFIRDEQIYILSLICNEANQISWTQEQLSQVISSLRWIQ